MFDKPAAASAPAPTADPQDPLPESDWTWRRGFVFIFGGIAMVFLLLAIIWLRGIGEHTLDLVGRIAATRDAKALDGALDVVQEAVTGLYGVAFWLIILVMADRILYLIAPSAEQVAKMMATVSAWKGGISTTSFARSTAPDGSTAAASLSAGPAATPPAPVAPAPAQAPAAIASKATEILE